MDIAAWLDGLGLGQYEQAFRDNEIDERVLASLTAEDLKDLGVKLVGHRRRLLDGIAALGTLAPIVAATAGTYDAAPRSDAERRQLTVMFCDLVGSTALASRLDPEDMREILGMYHECIADTTGQYDGFVARYMGDGALVYFGYPQGHEDDAERAVRSGLALIEAIHHLQTSEPLQVRIGVATGLVVVGDLVGIGDARDRDIVGETPNLAARLQALAEADTVVIAPATRRLLGDLFEYRDLGAVELKGFAGRVRAYQVLRASAVESRFEALHSAQLTPLVGRVEEIELLLQRWQRAISGDGQVVLLSGEPGIGKSRIGAVLLEKVQTEPHTRLRYFCSPYRTESALYPVISQFEHAARFEREDSPAAKIDKLATLLMRTAATRDEVALLAELLSLPVTDPDMAAHRLTPQQKKERTFAAIVRQLEALARQAPLVVLFEDAHWADPSSRELLEKIVELAARLPMLLVITFRSEYTPPWGVSPHVTAVTLNRLAPREATAVVKNISGIKALPDAIVREIVERTDGVPLFVEEVTRTVLEAGLDETSAARMLSAVPRLSLTVPATLQASLLARLDWLGVRAKQIAQIGAAIGREFSYRLLAAVAQRDETDIRTWLRRLSDAGLVALRGTAADTEYTFKHALLRDAAYSTLLRIQRQRLHERIAQILEERFPETIGAQPEILAHHYTEAGNNEKAVDYWILAGKRSAARSAIGEAVVQFEKGLARLQLMHESAERQHKELDLQCHLGSVRLAAYGYGAAQTGAAYDRARDLWWQLGSPLGFLRVPWGQWMYHINGGDLDEAQRCAEELLHLSQQQKDGSGVEVLAHLCVGICQNL
jgi:class 3 adenylate cyclase